MPTGRLRITVSQVDKTIVHDTLRISGQGRLDGEILLDLDPSVVPSSLLGEQLALIASNRTVGTLAVPIPHVGQGVFFGVQSHNNSLLASFFQAFPGDSDGDGLFLTNDLVSIFQSGKYEDDIPLNATWTEGDWNLDGDFTTSDLVLAFQTGTYESQPTLAVPEPHALALTLFAAVFSLGYSRRRQGQPTLLVRD